MASPSVQISITDVQLSVHARCIRMSYTAKSSSSKRDMWLGTFFKAVFVHTVERINFEGGKFRSFRGFSKF